jgi:hypothetical protein
MMRLMIAVGCAALMATGCDEADTDGAGGGGGGGTTGPATTGSGQQCYSVPVNETNDGRSACGPSTCDAGSYCYDSTGICDPGCLNELGCASGQTCDLSNPTPDLQDRPVGLCRAPNAAEETPCPSSTSSTSTGGSDCQTRCMAKANECDAPASIASAQCSEICASATEEQVTCLEQSSCAELGEAWEQGDPICGI